MISFESDYTEGAHPKILQKLSDTNFEQQPGYGNDCYTLSAKEKIKQICQLPNADVHLLTGGTQSNQIIIDTMLAPYEGVIAAKTGHVASHEAGAIEYTGHKVLTLPHVNGKINAEDLQSYLANFYQDANHEHMVFPGMVYISQPTEYGTLYTKEELIQLAYTCHNYQIPLFIDGARLGYGLMADDCDHTIADIAQLADVFYIGGTKIGALCGEAVVFTKGNTPKHFVTQIKQHGALLAKGRLLGIQFDTLFTNDLYFSISRHAIECANKVREIVQAKNYPFYIENSTNQIFIIISDDKLAAMKDQLRVSFWEKYDETHTVIRIATSWATTLEAIETLEEIL